ncbi:hypothetical protein Tco_1495279, partial [Tanacetum coccineum]
SGWLIEDLDNYHLKKLRCSAQCHTQMQMRIVSRGVVRLILLIGNRVLRDSEAAELSAPELKRLRCDHQFSWDTIVLQNDNELLEYMDVHDNDASESSQPSWGKIVYVGEVVYSTPLSMVCVKYSAYVRRIVADFSHVPPNG